MSRKSRTEEKSMALSQIAILVLGTIAFTFLIAQTGFVSADTSQTCSSLGGQICTSGGCQGGALVRSSDSNNCCLLPGTCSSSSSSSNTQPSGSDLNIPALTTSLTSLFPSTTQGLPTLNPLSGINAQAGIPTLTPSLPVEEGVNWGQVTSVTVTIIKDLAINAAIAYGVFWVAGMIKNALGVKPGDKWNYLATGGQFALAGGVFGALEVPALTSALGINAGFWTSAIGGGIIGVAAGLIIFALFYKTTQTNWVVVNCVPWQAPTGGNDCSKCGQNGLPCTAYQCKSLGQACQLFNAQGSGKPTCVWVNPSDVTPPTMTFLNALPSGYTYAPLNAKYPGDTGVLIKSSQASGAIPPFTSLPIGVMTDKASTCKMDIVRGTNYSSMAFTMAGGIDGTEGSMGYNHTVAFPIMINSTTLASLSAQKSGQFDLYFRCQSANGYADVNAFDVQFVVDTTPDHTAPAIVGENIQSGSPVPSGTTSTNVNVYVSDESGLSGCSWSHNNIAYSNMENNMTCSNSINLQGSFAGTFTCLANLTGIKSTGENDFYFACSDSAGNVNQQTTPYSLIGTQPLVISSVSPANGTTIKDSTNSVKVTLGIQTSAGANQGQATCYYSTDSTRYTTQFSNSPSYQNSQDLYLPAGAYTYYLKCVDAGGNAAYSSTHFNVQTDTQAPNVVRASHSGANLNIQTDENATCVYDIVDCTYPFDQGIQMSTTDGVTFSTSWVAGRTYYIKCQDTFGNQPAPNSCSIVLSPSSV